MPTNPETDFDGCNRECRKAGAHTLRWGGCERAARPEQTVSMSKIYKDPEDGYPSIGFDSYTVASLADLVAPALLMPEEGFAPPYSESYARALAIVVAKAIVHRNDPAAVPAVVSSPPAAGRATLMRAHVALAEQAGRDQAALARVRLLHDRLAEETDLTSPDDSITRGAAAKRIAAALDGWNPTGAPQCDVEFKGGGRCAKPVGHRPSGSDDPHVPAVGARQPDTETQPAWVRTGGFDQHDDYRTDVPAAGGAGGVADEGTQSDHNSGPGWYEVINPRNATTNIALVHEDGSLYLPEGDDALTADEFTFAAARGNAHRLMRADDQEPRP